MNDAPKNPGGWNFDNTWVTLPDVFFVRQRPQSVEHPQLAIFNDRLAKDLGLDAGHLSQSAALFAGNQLPFGADPLAQAYAGHQFGHLAMLGDGRAILLGEQIAPDARRFDVQLKGSGQTPFSRRGDGRAGLGPMLREYVISEAMHALGIPTTRSLAVATTGEPVYRETRVPGAVLTRVAASHLRVGSFEYAARLKGEDGAVAAYLQPLADYAIERHYPEVSAAAASGDPDRYVAFFASVVRRQAALIAKWLHVGFIHGVMNTDNMSICGETIDYGPCAFMDAYDPNTVFSSIDRQGRYAYGNQASIAQWNLARLAESLLTLFHPDPKQAIGVANAAVEAFVPEFEQAWIAGARAKLGLVGEEAGDRTLYDALLAWMHATAADYTNTLRLLADQLSAPAPGSDDAFRAWWQQWRERRDRQDRQDRSESDVAQLMLATNPAVIPRNHRVELALAAAVDNDDLAPVRRLCDVLAQPFVEPDDAAFTEPPAPSDQVYQTFCGT